MRPPAESAGARAGGPAVGAGGPAEARTERTRRSHAPPRILVAAVGNVLRGDDGFGPAVLERLEADGLPPGVRAMEVGIGGVALVHALMDGYDALVVVDAVDRGAEPGSLHLLEPAVPDPAALSGEERRAFTADMHEIVPARALLLARAAGVLPPWVRILGCQPAEVEELRSGLSPEVSRAVPLAVDRLRRLLAEEARKVIDGAAGGADRAVAGGAAPGRGGEE